MLGRIMRFFVSSSMFLALNGALVVVFADSLYGYPTSLAMFLAAFLATFSVYCLNKATDQKEDAINKPEVKLKNSVYYVVPSVTAMVISLALGLTISILTLLVLVAPFIIGFVYSVPAAKSIPRLKEIVGVKSFVVASSWAITGAFLPVTMQLTNPYKIMLVFIYIFCQLFVNTTIFDVLDTRGDSVSGVKTIPVAIGKRKTQVLALIMNSTLLIWLLYCSVYGFFISFLPALAFGVFYGYFIIWHFFKQGCKRLHAELMVDGEWLPIVFLMKIILR
ncbi:MAG: UbiA family prenyltransferase [Candidatus Bathyarchaeota archaeon]|nr:UbiA family prenyltransferase [Candidatus Bathyarchaeota archaeon]